MVLTIKETQEWLNKNKECWHCGELKGGKILVLPLNYSPNYKHAWICLSCNKQQLFNIEDYNGKKCSQEVKYTDNCKDIHLENVCLEYEGQYCSNCVRHWSICRSDGKCKKSNAHSCEL